MARKHEKPVIIMEPVKGGLLATPPPAVKEVFEEKDPDSTCAKWALKFAAGLDGIITVLSGMKNVEQMRENLDTFDEFGKLTDTDRAVISKAQEVLAKQPVIPCTTCNYCAKVCPNNIGISGSFEALNILTLYDNKKLAKSKERWNVKGQGKNASTKCIECGLCEEACPQNIPIREELKKAAEAFY